MMLRRRLHKQDSPVCALCQYRLSQTSTLRARRFPATYRVERQRSRALHTARPLYSNGSSAASPSSAWAPPNRSTGGWGSTTSSTSPVQSAFGIPKRRNADDLDFMREVESRAKVKPAAASQNPVSETPSRRPFVPKAVDPKVKARYVWNSEQQQKIEVNEARIYALRSRGPSPFKYPHPGVQGPMSHNQGIKPLGGNINVTTLSSASATKSPSPNTAPARAAVPTSAPKEEPKKEINQERKESVDSTLSKLATSSEFQENKETSSDINTEKAQELKETKTSHWPLHSENKFDDRRPGRDRTGSLGSFQQLPKDPRRQQSIFQNGPVTSSGGWSTTTIVTPLKSSPEWGSLARKPASKAKEGDAWTDMINRLAKKPPPPAPTSSSTTATSSSNTATNSSKTGTSSFGDNWDIRDSDNPSGTAKGAYNGSWDIRGPTKPSETRNSFGSDWPVHNSDNSFQNKKSSFTDDWGIRDQPNVGNDWNRSGTRNRSSNFGRGLHESNEIGAPSANRQWNTRDPNPSSQSPRKSFDSNRAPEVSDAWNNLPDVAPVKTPSPSADTSGTQPEEPVGRRSRRHEESVDEPDRDRKAGKRSGKKSGGGGGKRSRRRGNDEDDEFDYESYHEQRESRARRKAQREAERTEPIPIILPELINVSAFAKALKIAPDDFLTQLSELGFEEVTSDSLMAGETAALVAQEYGYEPTVEAGESQDLKPRPPPEDSSILPERPPVITIMGHVDHGKTTLLDYLRQSSVAAQEHGGITQHIGAFSVKLSSGKPITFLDTPGHAAFLTMRQRGANVTDIVVLVVAADDSVKPQTLEALKHARAAKVPMIVAITKIDKEGARVEQVKNDLAQHGVEIEDFGGDVQVVCVSGKTGAGMEDLEENILTLSEILDHRAETDGPAEGWVLESSQKTSGKAATVLVKRGTLRPGDHIAAGRTWAKIRNLRNEAGVDIEEAPPGTPVEILGWRVLPAAGDQVIQGPGENEVKRAVSYRVGLYEREQDAAEHESISEARKAHQDKRAQEKEDKVDRADKGSWGAGVHELPTEDNGTKIVNFSVKGDVHGSVEAVCAVVQEVGNHEVRPRILRSATGPIAEFDVEHAAMSKSFIINFATETPSHIAQMAEEQGVEILEHNIIYRLVDDVKARLSEYLEPILSSRVLGEAEILQVFPINIKGRKYKNIAGCRVRNGVVAKANLYRVVRNGETIYDGKLETLKNVKKDVTEMRKGTECGMGFEEFQDLEVGDQIQAYEEVRTPRYL
ncbi:hypothetical protein F5Y16DRAFT_360085 [Xylariaceae sp. FL0255]|nr:hypothetical protein F5Y16DRAFT_360085 [Xylariaceae sp. FL0255]